MKKPMNIYLIIIPILVIVAVIFFIRCKTPLFNTWCSELNPTSISMNQALDIAQTTIVKNNPGFDLVIQNDKTIIKDYGWIFFYTTKKYLETRDPKYLIPGNSPLIVTLDANVHFLTTSVPPEKAIQEFENDIRFGRNARL